MFKTKTNFQFSQRLTALFDNIMVSCKKCGCICFKFLLSTLLVVRISTWRGCCRKTVLDYCFLPCWLFFSSTLSNVEEH